MEATARVFDSLSWFDKFKSAGVPEGNARVFAEALRSQSEAHTAAMRETLREYDGTARKDLATKADIQAARDEIQEVRNEIQEVRNEVQDVRVTLTKEIQDVRNAVQKEIQDVRNAVQKEIQDVRNEVQKEIQDVRNEVQDVRNEVQDVRLTLTKEIADSKHEILKWMVMSMIGMAAFMAAGFGLMISYMARG